MGGVIGRWGYSNDLSRSSSNRAFASSLLPQPPAHRLFNLGCVEAHDAGLERLQELKAIANEPHSPLAVASTGLLQTRRELGHGQVE